jgi:hypothetical protein
VAVKGDVGSKTTWQRTPIVKEEWGVEENSPSIRGLSKGFPEKGLFLNSLSRLMKIG